MNIKYILGILVVILLIGNVFFIYEMQSSNQSKSIVIGNNSLILPNNYYVNQIDVSDGSDNVIISKIGSVTVDSAVNEYVNTNSENYSITVTEFDSKLPDKKTVAVYLDNSSIIKYWFEVDNIVYQIQVPNKNINEYDDFAKNLINSAAQDSLIK